MSYCRGWLLACSSLAMLLSSPVSSFPAGLTPEQALARFKVPLGFSVRLVAAEPLVRQPVTMTFDDRGRLWVIQYLQYPNPAGLRPIKVDEYLRTKYDRFPEPPPRGPRGADRVTILEDTDGDGRVDRAKDFVSGLNLASGLALGHGGVFVLQAPYLLFYADRNRDDIPDSDPEVLLSGFGLEDAHAVANSLQWGPDGWLYGAQGSTVTANIRGIEFQQGIWRYHPLTRQFELFAEGGGNTWGLDFDRHGNAIAGTNFGSRVMLHQVQGGYYVKGFAKHGPLHNPYTFGYLEHVPYADPKYLHSEHVTPGGIVYHGGTYPVTFSGQYIAASLLRGAVFWHRIEREGSSFTTRWGGELLTTDDRCFRPVDCFVGPDGSVYVADWYDIRANHVDPRDDWDKDTGRIYAVVAEGTKPASGWPLCKKTSDQLVDLLAHPNNWYAREARRLLAERRDREVLPRLRSLMASGPHQVQLEALWTLYVTGGFSDDFALGLLDHPNEDVRVWTVRLLGDARRVAPAILDRLVKLAGKELSPVVRNQLACSIKRLPGDQTLSVVRELVLRDEDVKDVQIPLLIWWAIEDKMITHRAGVLSLLQDAEVWQRPVPRQFLVERIARRFAAEATDAGYAACAWLLARAPDEGSRQAIVRGMDEELAAKPLRQVPPCLVEHLERLWDKQPTAAVVSFAMRLGSADARTRALALIAGRGTADAERLRLIETVSQVGGSETVAVLLGLIGDEQSSPVQGAALVALKRFSDPVIAEQVLSRYIRLRPDLRGRAWELLAGRKVWAQALLAAVDQGRIPFKDVTPDQVRPLLLHNDATLNRLAEKHWGLIRPATPGETQVRLRNYAGLLGQGKGNPASGYRLFSQHCATCHQMFGEGNKIGPELTGADRQNRAFLLASIVDPSGVMRSEYIAHVVETTDGRVLVGLLAEQTPRTITLLDAKNQRTVLPRELMTDLKPSPVSLMPDNLLDLLKPQEVRDLFSFLQQPERDPSWTK